MNSSDLKKAYKSVSSDFDNTAQELRAGANEASRAVDVLHRTRDILDDLDQQFAVATGLDQTDIVFLFLAAGLQIARQYLLSNEKLKLQDIKKDGKVIYTSSQRGDDLVESVYSSTIGLIAPPDWNDVLFQSVPYDAVPTSDLFNYSTGLSGTTHRFRTLGHDPLLGWIFGTANIITNSLTKTDLDTFCVKEMHIMRRYPLGCAGMLRNAVSYSVDDPTLLVAAVARQAIHYGSDYFTTQGLPLPLIASVDNDLAKEMLSKWHIDMWSVTKGAVIASFFNQLIAAIHMLFFTGKTEMERKLYEVRTRKILSYSNLIATSSNVAVVAITGDFTKLDIGGMAVAVYRLITDGKFIRQIKEEFIFGTYRDMIGE